MGIWDFCFVHVHKCTDWAEIFCGSRICQLLYNLYSYIASEVENWRKKWNSTSRPYNVTVEDYPPPLSYQTQPQHNQRISLHSCSKQSWAKGESTASTSGTRDSIQLAFFASSSSLIWLLKGWSRIWLYLCQHCPLAGTWMLQQCTRRTQSARSWSSSFRLILNCLLNWIRFSEYLKPKEEQSGELFSALER